ncbi:hypothetical protein TCAL_06420 [Tigriopus californicus]|uniref:Uncharacterized protein n=1 Tax=Tigriopus californicus TaxID=6832 RepID=A0A553NQ30_TIGCA|nr:hypothetical protein TCAL_06420 [Tigriopus californicus]
MKTCGIILVLLAAMAMQACFAVYDYDLDEHPARDPHNFVDTLEEYDGHPRDLWNFLEWRRALQRHLRGSNPTLGRNYVKRQRFDARMKKAESWK